MTAPSKPHFEAGQWVVCVETGETDGGRRVVEGELHKAFNMFADSAGDEYVGIEGSPVPWLRRRFRPATPAEIAAAQKAAEPSEPPVHEQMRELRERVERLEEKLAGCDAVHPVHGACWHSSIGHAGRHSNDTGEWEGPEGDWQQRATRAESALAEAREELERWKRDFAETLEQRDKLEADLARYREAFGPLNEKGAQATRDQAMLGLHRLVAAERAKYAALVYAAQNAHDALKRVKLEPHQSYSLFRLLDALDALPARPPAESAQSAEPGELSADACGWLIDKHEGAHCTNAVPCEQHNETGWLRKQLAERDAEIAALKAASAARELNDNADGVFVAATKVREHRDEQRRVGKREVADVLSLLAIELVEAERDLRARAEAAKAQKAGEAGV